MSEGGEHRPHAARVGRSAVRPGKTDALYYVSRGDGSSQFSRSIQEHNRAVTKYQLRGGR